MGRIIGLDYGRRRTGVAVTDPMQLCSFPLKTISSDVVIPFLQGYMARKPLDRIVVGWPLELSGAPGRAASLVARFVADIQHHFPAVPVVRYDERFTSVMARRSLMTLGLGRKQRRDRARVDTLSAVFILRSFLERQAWLKARG